MQKHALVTGGSRGIGAAIARLLAKEGFRVTINYFRSEDAATRLCDDIRQDGGKAHCVRADVASEAEAVRLCGAAAERFGPVDLLVNNAGLSLVGLFHEIPPTDWQRMFAVNVHGAFHCAAAVLPDMIRRQSGCIVNISSMWGQVGASCEVHYSAAKAALIGFTKALAAEVGPSGITVNCVTPGLIDTDMNRTLDPAALDAIRAETPLGRIGTPEDVAEAVRFLASDQAGFITGQVIGVNGGFVL